MVCQSSCSRERALGSSAWGNSLPKPSRRPVDERLGAPGTLRRAHWRGWRGWERQRTNWGPERWLSALGASPERACARLLGAPDWRGGADSCVYGGWGGEWVKGGSVNRAKAVSPPPCHLRTTLREPRWRWKTSRSSGEGRWRLGEPRLDGSILLSALLRGRNPKEVPVLRLPLDTSGGGGAMGAAGRLPFPPLLRNSLPRRRHLESSALGLAPPYRSRSQSASETHDS